MEARLRHWIIKKKRLLWLFISQFWLFFTELWDINSQLRVIKSELHDINSQLRVKVQFFFGGADMFSELQVYISQLWLFNSRLRVYITQFWEKKNQNCEIKSCNYLFLFFIQWQNRASVLYCIVIRYCFVFQNVSVCSMVMDRQFYYHLAATYYSLSTTWGPHHTFRNDSLLNCFSLLHPWKIYHLSFLVQIKQFSEEDATQLI